MSYEFNITCPAGSGHSTYGTYCNHRMKLNIADPKDFHIIHAFSCTSCRRLFWARPHYCDNCSQPGIIVKSDANSFSPTFKCLNCDMVYTIGKKKEEKKDGKTFIKRKPVGVFALFSLFNKTPRFIQDPVHTCTSCQDKTIWYEFTKNELKVFCSLCNKIFNQELKETQDV